MSAFAASVDGGVEVYRQEPITDSRWTVAGQPVVWTACSERRIVTLTLTDADLTLP